MVQKDRKGKGKAKAPKEEDDSAGDYDPLYASTTDEGSDSVKAPDDLLVCAEERLLRSAPPTSTTQALPAAKRNGRAAAWVVFCGRKTGVFLTWPATQHQISGHQGSVQKGYKTVEAANEAWAHALANETALASGELGPTPTRKQSAKAVAPTQPSQRRQPPAVPRHFRTTSKPQQSASVEGISSRAAGLCLSDNEVSPPRPSRRGAGTKARRPSPPPSTSFRWPPIPSISTPGSSYPAASRQKAPQKTKFTQSAAGPSVQSHASPSMQTISDPWWVVIQGTYPGVYPERDEAQAALGAEDPRAIEKVGSLTAANQVFVTAYMEGNVVQNFF